MEICFDIYVINGQSKQTLQISFELRTLFQKLVQKTSNMKVYYVIPLNYQLTGHAENLKIKHYIIKSYIIFKKD